MSTTCLVTGGAGFIGCAISELLPEHFDRIVAFDNLHPQVHPEPVRPAALDPRVEFVHGDVTSAADWDELLQSVSPDVIVHLAAETGTGQSLTEATRHAAVNVVGTTEMLDALVRHGIKPKKIVLSSSRAVYGEGAWSDEAGALHYPGQRSDSMLESGQWDFAGLRPAPFDSATTVANPTSVYGSTKLAQENILTSWCLALGVSLVMFRLQNVYGPGQALSNPYTGIVSLFAQLARQGKSIPLYEDGQIIRDFVFIDDVARAIVLGTVNSETNRNPYDIGSGQGTSIATLAGHIATIYDAPAPHINGLYRNGDVRSASCSIDAATHALNWQPRVMVDEGIVRLCTWIDSTLGD